MNHALPTAIPFNRIPRHTERDVLMTSGYSRRKQVVGFQEALTLQGRRSCEKIVCKHTEATDYSSVPEPRQKFYSLPSYS